MQGTWTTLMYMPVIAAIDDKKQEQRTIVLEKNLSEGQEKSSYGFLRLSRLDKGSPFIYLFYFYLKATLHCKSSFLFSLL